MSAVPVSEFARDFPAYRASARREPVVLESEGEVAGYFVLPDDAALLAHIKANRQAYYVSELPADLMQAIEDAEPPAESYVLNALVD